MVLVIKPTDIKEKISNKKTGEEYKNDDEWKAKKKDPPKDSDNYRNVKNKFDRFFSEKPGK